MQERLIKYATTLFGDPRTQPISYRIFNAVTLVNGSINLIGSFASFFLPNALELFVLNFGTGVLFLLYYYLSRFRGLHYRLFWPFNGTILLFLSVNWFLNGGASGGSHYYLIPALVIATMLLERRSILPVYSVYVFVTGILFSSEVFYPELITGRATGAERTMDLSGNYIFVQILTGILIFILSRNLEFETEKSERLLRNILPETVAAELKAKNRVEPLHYDAVSVLFADMVGFTALAAKMTPEELIEELDSIFRQFDTAVSSLHMEKIKTIGDAYMAAAGVPVRCSTHAVDAVLCALRLLKTMEVYGRKRRIEGKTYWGLRVGIHSGPLIAGVVGSEKFSYDIWGDTVNTASRMESHGIPGRVNISAETYELIKEFFECESRGIMQVKGKGEVEMYLVKGLRPELHLEGRPGKINDGFRDLYDALKEG